MHLLWIALGSGLGGCLRHGVDQLLLASAGAGFPFATLLANFSGSLLIGFFAALWVTAERADKRYFWITGFCGGYTTFSAFSAQVLRLIEEGEATVAGFYAATSVGSGLFAVWVGLSIAAAIQGPRDSEKGASE